MDKGFIQFIGVNQTNVHFNLAVEEKTKEGTGLLLIADSRAIINVRTPTDWGARPFYIVELILDEKNEGEGKIHSAAWLDFRAAGSVTIQSYRNEPQMLVNVRPIK